MNCGFSIRICCCKGWQPAVFLEGHMRKILICLFGLLCALFVHVHAADAKTDIGAGILDGGAAEVHWTVAGNPYVITSGSITVAESSTLIIDAGVVVKLQGTSITVSPTFAIQRFCGRKCLILRS
jgi:hypothetical protein